MILKTIIRHLLSLFILTPVVAGEVDANVDRYVGQWSGEGRFYNVKLTQKLGSVPFEIKITPDYRISGSVGNASLEDAELSIDKHNGGFMIKGRIDGKIFKEQDFHKKKVIFLMQIPENDQIDGDFHLKNNFFFDIMMRPGDFTLKRIP